MENNTVILIQDKYDTGYAAEYWANAEHNKCKVWEHNSYQKWIDHVNAYYGSYIGYVDGKFGIWRKHNIIDKEYVIIKDYRHAYYFGEDELKEIEIYRHNKNFNKNFNKKNGITSKNSYYTTEITPKQHAENCEKSKWSDFRDKQRLIDWCNSPDRSWATESKNYNDNDDEIHNYNW